MDCEIVRQNLLDYSRRRLSPDETQSIGKHLEVCKECRLFLEDERALELRLLDLPMPVPQNDVWAAVSNNIQHHKQNKYGLPISLLSPRRLVAAVAVIAVFLIVLVTGSFQPKQTPEHQQIVQEMVQHQAESQVAAKWTDDPLGDTTDQIIAVLGEEL